MMDRFLLRHLTMVGPDVRSASVDFSESVTVIYGASDTGKSYIVDAIDYMLGAARLREIPQSRHYTRSFIGMATSSGEELTLSRALTGGDFQLVRGDARTLTTEPGEETLSRKHSSANRKNISNYLLSAIGLEGCAVRRNARNETRVLSFRDVAHFTLIDETRMQAQRSPAFPAGQYTTQTGDRSVFRLFITGEDDSGLVPDLDPQRKRISNAKLEVINRLIREAEEDLSSGDGIEATRAQLGRLIESIDSTSAAVDELMTQREALITAVHDSRTQTLALQLQSAELSDLTGRFELLERQYESDLARLDMIREAGSLLGYFDVGTCVFCGASPEHQAVVDHMQAESTQIAVAVTTEIAKTTTLLGDLRVTLEDLRVQQADVASQRRSSEDLSTASRSRLAQVDEMLRPHRAALRELIEERSSLEQRLSMHDRLQHYMSIRREISNVDVEPDPSMPSMSDARELREFSETVRRTLSAWGVPGSENVTFNATVDDLMVGDQVRAHRGKGMRAILHAAFTVSLATYCFERNLPHPGFVVLDSPVVTFRDPDSSLPLDEEYMSRNVADRFFEYMSDVFAGQAIVVENVNPPEGLIAKASIERFSGTNIGRRGFFPE